MSRHSTWDLIWENTKILCDLGINTQNSFNRAILQQNTDDFDIRTSKSICLNASERSWVPPLNTLGTCRDGESRWHPSVLDVVYDITWIRFPCKINLFQEENMFGLRRITLKEAPRVAVATYSSSILLRMKSAQLSNVSIFRLVLGMTGGTLMNHMDRHLLTSVVSYTRYYSTTIYNISSAYYSDLCRKRNSRANITVR